MSHAGHEDISSTAQYTASTATEKVPHNVVPTSFESSGHLTTGPVYTTMEHTATNASQHSSTNNTNNSSKQAYATAAVPPPVQLYPVPSAGANAVSANDASESPTNSATRLRQPAQVVSSRQFEPQAEPNLAFKIGKFIPCIFIAAVIGWSYYAFVVHILLYYYRSKVGNLGLTIYLLIHYHLILALFVWSWLKTVLTKPTSVGASYRLTTEEQQMIHLCRTIPRRNSYFEQIISQRGLTVVQRLDKNHPGDFRYCKKTHAIKPDRAHYDSMTKRLVLKMDHYCPWVANCIGYSNYKFFVLFLFYAILYCWTIVAVTIRPFLEVWRTQPDKSTSTTYDATAAATLNEPSGFKMQCILVFLVSGVFSLSILFLFGFHCYLVSRNRTTIECYGAPVIRNVGECKHAYDIGCMPNWRQVMGRSIWAWLLPIEYDAPGLEHGHRFPLSPLLETNQAIDEV